MLIFDHTSAANALDAGRTATSRAARKIANNTYLIRREDGDFAIRLHNTQVVIYHADGTVTLDSGGFQSPTTKDRMNTYSPFRVDSVKGTWTVSPKDNWTNVIRYFDGIRIAPDGALVNAPAEDLDAMAERDDETQRLIDRYMRGLTRERLQELVADARERGMNGDCWDCLMHTEEGVPMGDAFGKTDHLRSHLEERYYMLSLILNALTERGYPDPTFIVQIGALDMVKRALRKYFVRRLMENRQGRMPVGA